MAFGVLMGQIAVIFLEVMLGYAGARCGVITDRDSRFLSDFIMKLLLPCTMLAGAAIDDEPEIVLQAGVLFVLLLALFIATTGICRLVSRVRRGGGSGGHGRHAELRVHRAAAVCRPAGQRPGHRVRYRSHGCL